MPSRILLLLLLSTATAAQEATGQGTDSPAKTTPPGRLAIKDYSVAESRRLFAGCDANSDDRLDLFEASAAVETLGQPRDRDAFRRFDKDRDGYLTFPEFDTHFREVVQHGDPLRLRTCREMPPVQIGVREAARSPAQHLLDLFDRDGSNDLRDAELDALLGALKLPPVFGAVLRSLDKDASGGVDERELTTVLQSIPGGLPPGLLDNSTVGPG
jgi:Ca2+-binding EF-hand superfamily protein